MAYYELLGVAPNASFEEIHTAYKGLSRIYHPDRPGGDKAKMQQLNHIYKILSNPRSRHKYDRYGGEQRSTGDIFSSIVGLLPWSAGSACVGLLTWTFPSTLFPIAAVGAIVYAISAGPTSRRQNYNLDPSKTFAACFVGLAAGWTIAAVLGTVARLITRIIFGSYSY
uniref:J domain-containing protein n=1 Tax=Aureoumbra lagunensis TaxID=44058 RepID=A0A7S3K1Q2_9STRA|mmetsp:Transcript_14024/g.18716  ORF Transcript_14024/g.18716 Transcript_14024/m.18716 type:complete len:168 (+) Transcript_14024:40-543(+)